MRKLLLILFFLVVVFNISIGQIITTSPTFFTADQEVTITYDATQGNAGLTNATSVFMHSGVILASPTSTVWSNVVGQWGNPASPGQMQSIGNNKWQIKITPRTYYNVPTGTAIYRLGMVFRSAGPCGGFSGNNTPCQEGKTATNGDIFVEVSQGGLQIQFLSPSESSSFVNLNDQVNITAKSSQLANLKIFVNNDIVASQNNVDELTYNLDVTTSTDKVIRIVAEGATTVEKERTLVVRKPPLQIARPGNYKLGVNFISNKIGFLFLAPQKSNVYLVGDFNNWQLSSNFQMNKDGDYFWLEIDALANNQEYAYQYYIDEQLYVADPFTEKILDPGNDQFITPAVYPSLKPYPTGKATGIVSVFQTGKVPFNWQATNYVRPKKEDLVVYELLVRDFDTPQTYQSVIDRLDYLESLGINAIELMPIMEFAGNNSWGYNPIFYVAADKAYGPDHKLKELIDECHKRGIAVILDMVLNQADFEFPYVKMYWQDGKPANNSPFFNRDARHPFNVFFDFNHESDYTKLIVDEINKFWLTEFKFDGFRFDLSKGFTQRLSTDVGVWNNYDQSRVDLLTRMANKIWETDNQAYVILEHLGIDDEERVLTNNGMLVWGKMTDNYKQNTLGFSDNSSIERTFYKNRFGTWNNKSAVVAYMESHDEERLMVLNQQFGNSSGSYNVRSLNTGLERMKAAHMLLLSIPGPKMIWQFGELGYDFSINFCENQTISEGCRTSPKPIRWDYAEVTARQKLNKFISAMNNLKINLPVFESDDVTFFGGSNLYKGLVIRNTPFTANPISIDQTSVLVVANFDVTARSQNVTFPSTGNWFDYFNNNKTLQVQSTSQSISLAPGEFKLFTNFKLTDPEQELTLFSPCISPEIVSIQNVNNSISLSWEDNSSIEVRYFVYRKLSTDNTFTKIRELNPNSTSFTDNNIQSDKLYQYYVAAVNSTGIESISEEVEIRSNIITSVDGEVSSLSILPYPNPNDGEFFINDFSKLEEVEIFNLTGQKIDFNSTVDGKINISAKPGVYVLRALYNDNIIVNKFIIK